MMKSCSGVGVGGGGGSVQMMMISIVIIYYSVSAAAAATALSMPFALIKNEISLTALYFHAEKIDRIKTDCHQMFDNCLNEIQAKFLIYKPSAYCERFSFHTKQSSQQIQKFRSETIVFFQNCKNTSVQIVNGIKELSTPTTTTKTTPAKAATSTITKKSVSLRYNHRNDVEVVPAGLNNQQNEIYEYYEEFDYLNSIFNETIDEVIEFLDIMLSRIDRILFHSNENYQNTFDRKLLHTSDNNYNNYSLCAEEFRKFTQHFIQQTFECITEIMPWIYNMYYTYKEEALSTLKMMKMRYDQIRNCIEFNNYLYYCRGFVKDNEQDVKQLIDKLIDLQFYNVQQRIRMPTWRRECLPHRWFDIKLSSAFKKCVL